jgi:hypothetical protein
MKKTIKLMAMLLSLAAVSVFTACNNDDDDIDDLINNGPDLADGYYIVGDAVSADTTTANAMTQGRVSAPDFATQDRPGLYEAYVYMGSGSFSFVKVEGDDVTELGGTFADSTGTDPDEDQDYIVGLLSDGGTATSPFSGLVHVSVDETTGQYVIMPVTHWELIGTATGSWDNGQELAVKSSSADEVVFEGTNITLRDGEMKFRANSSWGINMELDTECDNSTSPCFYINTNFGGTVSALVSGIGGSNGNIAFEGDGVYTATITYTPGSGISSMTASIERTGDAAPITFDPNEYDWGIIGDGTAGSWDNDRDLFYKGTDETKGHWWAGVIYLAETGNMKFRANDGWDVNLGGALTSDGAEATLSAGGDNIPVPGTAGAYYVELYTADEGDTWKATMVASGWGVIGDGSPQGNWDADVDMTANGFTDGVTTYTVTGDFTTSGWKFRANDDWAINVGGDLENLTLDGANIELAAGGTYTVTLSIGLNADGDTVYSATVE